MQPGKTALVMVESPTNPRMQVCAVVFEYWLYVGPVSAPEQPACSVCEASNQAENV